MRLKKGDLALDFTFTDQSGNQISLDAFLKEGKTILYFLRYIGCPVCQYEISKLTHKGELIESHNIQVIVILQSKVENVNAHHIVSQFPFTIACDPKGELFQLYHVPTGNILSYIAGFSKGLKVIFKGMKHGRFEGKEMQLPADFLIDKDGIIQFAHYGKNPGDSTPIEKILEHTAS
jgi:peroxiredoxin